MPDTICKRRSSGHLATSLDNGRLTRADTLSKASGVGYPPSIALTMAHPVMPEAPRTTACLVSAFMVSQLRVKWREVSAKGSGDPEKHIRPNSPCLASTVGVRRQGKHGQGSDKICLTCFEAGNRHSLHSAPPDKDRGPYNAVIETSPEFGRNMTAIQRSPHCLRTFLTQPLLRRQVEVCRKRMQGTKHGLAEEVYFSP